MSRLAKNKSCKLSHMKNLPPFTFVGVGEHINFLSNN